MSSIERASSLHPQVRWPLRLVAAVIAGFVLFGPITVARAQDAGYYEDTDPSALGDFRAELDPYGAWVNDPTYGTLWVPSTATVGADFVPYRTAGRWAVAEDGSWVWVSDYSWGSVAFHYGRWVSMSGVGWGWVPGRTYAPAWVVWRVGAPGYDYVGWAPMAPSYLWRNGVAVGFFGSAILPFWYIGSQWLFDPLWHSHMLTDHQQLRDVHAHSGYVEDGGDGHTAANAHADGTESAPSEPPAGAGASAGDGKKSRSRAPDMRGKPLSPSFQQARIAAAQQPTARVKHDQRALAYSKPASAGGKGSAPAVKSSPANRPETRSAAARAARQSSTRRRVPVVDIPSRASARTTPAPRVVPRSVAGTSRRARVSPPPARVSPPRVAPSREQSHQARRTSSQPLSAHRSPGPRARPQVRGSSPRASSGPSRHSATASPSASGRSRGGGHRR
ncbi:MAG: hypothetical protein IT373_00775 [Polyangiaceae bacterium]|nr:hypothetical protein [Polyangiaceae bacterium]